MKNRSISCLCLTHGRVRFLEESLFSFINQEYEGEKELVLLNDNPWQELRFEHPDVRIINLKDTFRFWGEKESYGISQCKYDTIVQFDDDDISMPWLLSTINKYFIEGSHLMHWNRAVFYQNGIREIKAVGNSGIVFTKEAVEMVGGYPCRNTGADMDFVKAIARNKGNIVRAYPNDDEVCWFYCWQRAYHASGQGDDSERPEEEQIIERNKRYTQKQRESGKEPDGIIYLKPHWKRDYSQMLKDYMKIEDEKSSVVNTDNLDGWSISSEMFSWIRKRLPESSCILEFGAGRGTIELAKHYDVISIEHNKKWIGLSPIASYYYAELKDGWYDTKVASKAIKGKDIKMIIIDGPSGEGNRAGVIDFIKANPHLAKASIIVDDTHREKEQALAEQISVITRRKNIHIQGHEKAFDII